MSRSDFRRPIAGHVAAIRQALSMIPAEKRLHVIAEALYDLNPTGKEEVSRASCGCYEWDISMDYRNADSRYPQNENTEGGAV